MLPRERILRSAAIFLMSGLLSAFLAACANHVSPAPSASAVSVATPAPAPAIALAVSTAGKPVPYSEFADLQYYQLTGAHKLAVEFYDGSGTLVTDLSSEMQNSTTASVLHVKIFGNKVGPETTKFVWDTEGNAIYYIDVGTTDLSKLHVIYDDDQGPHDLPLAGSRDQPFEEEHRTPLKADAATK